MKTTEFPWHQTIWDKFSAARSRNHLPHALLLTGEEGIGKKRFAEKLVKSLLCHKPLDNQQACGQCNGCKTYLAGSNPDFLQIQIAEDKQQISVDQIRALSRFITLSRSFTAYRVILLHPGEAMNDNAANSLLKSLEEPAENTVIIIIATHLNQLLPTIKSRCQLLALPKPATAQALEWMQNYSPSLENAQARLDLSFGRPLLALEADEKDIKQASDLAEDILSVMEEKKSITEAAKTWEKATHSTLIDWQLGWLQSFIKDLETGVTKKSDSPLALDQCLSNIKQQIRAEPCWELYQQILQQKKYIHTSVNPLMFIENMLSLWFKASHQC